MVAVYFNITVYAVCFQLQAPIEPFLVERLGKGQDADLAYGKVQSIFGTSQAVGTFLIGPLLDRIGARTGLVVVFASAFCSYSLLANATSMNALYLSKVPAALQHPFLVAQTFVASQARDEDRAEALGLLVTAFTAGATVGPAIGGWIGASGDYYMGAKLAASGMLLNLLVALLAPSAAGAGGSSGEKATAHDEGQNRGVVSGLFLVLANPAVVLVFITKLLSSTFNSMYGVAQPLILKNIFGLEETGMGAVMSASMGCNAIASAVMVGPLSRRVSASTLLCAFLLLIGVCYLLQAALMPGSTGLQKLLEVAPLHPAGPFVAFGLLLNATAFARSALFTTVSTAVVPTSLRGTAIGMEHTVFSLAAAWTPALSTRLLVAAGAKGVCAVVGLLEISNALSWRVVAAPVVARAEAAKVRIQEEKKTE